MRVAGSRHIGNHLAAGWYSLTEGFAFGSSTDRVSRPGVEVETKDVEAASVLPQECQIRVACAICEQPGPEDVTFVNLAGGQIKAAEIMGLLQARLIFRSNCAGIMIHRLY